MISESATILIVEDEQDIRELLAYNLEKEGYATVQAADGKEGLELARSRKPDLILLDLMLPKMDGLAVCRELERDSGTVRIPMTDHPGIIAEVTGMAGHAACNIQSIEIDHINEDTAVLELILTDEGDMGRFGGELITKGYDFSIRSLEEEL